MQTQFAGNHKSSFLAKVTAATRPIQKLWTSLFGGIAWPYIELAIRLWCVFHAMVNSVSTGS
jgi:hypothetical protein